MEETNDLVAKNLEAYPDVAADIVNALVHKGKQVVNQQQLLSSATESLYQGAEVIRNQLEDIAKYEMIDGTVNVAYLFANQTSYDKGMLLRKAGYTGAIYREQYDGKALEMYPVMELILYWGKSRWQRNRDLRSMFKQKKLTPNVWNYIDNLKLNVWEMRHLPAEIRSRFQSDMRIVVDYLAEGSAYRSTQKVVHKEALIKMIRVLGGDKYVENTASILKEMNVKEEDEITMCELFDQYTRKGVNQGRSQGISQVINVLIHTCKEVGLSFEETREKLEKQLNLSDAEVQENMNRYW